MVSSKITKYIANFSAFFLTIYNVECQLLGTGLDSDIEKTISSCVEKIRQRQAVYHITCYQDMVALGPEAIPRLLSLMDDDDSNVAEQVILAIGDLITKNEKEVLFKIAERLDDRHSYVRNASMRVLYKNPIAELVPVLRKTLETSKSKGVWRGTFLILGMIEDPTANQVLEHYWKKGLKDPLLDACLRALARHQNPKALTHFIRILKKGPGRKQYDTLEKMKYIQAPQMIAAIAPYLYNEGYPPDKKDPPRFFHRYCDLAVHALDKIVPQPFFKFGDFKVRITTDEELQKWREWWGANKENYPLLPKLK